MKNSILKLKCIDITVDFYGICKHDGLVIFVKGLIPEEVANVKIINIKNKIAYGIIDELFVKSKYRTCDKCSVAYKCGGCDLQHIEYNYQLLLKKKIIENNFKKMKLNIKINSPIPSIDTYGYRNKIQVPVCNQKIGYYRNHTNDIVEFDNCHISDTETNEILKFIKELLISYSISSYIRHIVIRKLSDNIMVCFVTNTFDIPHINEIVNLLSTKYSNIKSIMSNLNTKDTNVIFGNTDKCLYGDEYIIDSFNNLKFMVPLRSFYQVNSKQMLKLYETALNMAQFSKDDKVLDLFCGIGTISLYISKQVNKVLGIEIVDKSIEFANKNKEMNNINNVEFIKSDANDISKYINDYNVILLDPPRKGMDSMLVDTIVKSKINKIIYISCNQATLARDLSLLKDYFKISSLQPIDMFPNTKHIECVVSLTR